MRFSSLGGERGRFTALFTLVPMVSARACYQGCPMKREETTPVSTVPSDDPGGDTNLESVVELPMLPAMWRFGRGRGSRSLDARYAVDTSVTSLRTCDFCSCVQMHGF
eukprot:Skav218836  [mRNA]  locus=scaffold3029:76492:76815:- [translate_table: standard]